MRRHLSATVLIVLSAVGGCARDAGPSGTAAVATAHPLATDVAVAVLQDGGNAVDAAVAASFALAVVEPYSSGLGGGGFFVSHMEGPDRDLTLDARETAPLDAERDLFLRDGVADPSLSRTGALAVAVPSLVAGLEDLHDRLGRLPWARLVQPAVALARDGFPVDELLVARIEYHAERFDPAAADILLPGGSVPAVGSLLVQADLARTLERVAAERADEFRTGPTAAAIVRSVREAGGRIRAEDLAAYRTVWREPIRGAYRGLDMVGMPPPSSGGLHLAQMMRMLEPRDLSGSGHNTAATLHDLAGAMTFAFADRSRWLGDPDHVHVPVARLLSPTRLDSLMARVTPDAVIPWTEAGGLAAPAAESEHTTHLSILDAEGNAVAATLTLNLSFGSGMVAAGTGVILNDEMDDFAAAPGVPNAFGLVGGEANSVAPGKRPLSSMTPTILLRDGDVAMVVGSPGGSRIITATLQTILNVVDHGLAAAEAVAAPRIHHQWLPPVLYHEPDGLPAGTMEDLVRRGHTLALKTSMGNVQVIVVDENGGVDAASDPRGMGAAKVVSPGDGVD